MEKTIYLNELYDYYQELLTEKQQMFYEEYYFHNLSLNELTNNINEAKKLMVSAEVTQEKIDEAVISINNAINSLIKKVDNVVSDKLLEEIKEIL